MASKVTAAKKLSFGGIPTIIANGLTPGILRDVFSGKETGTLFLPSEASLCSRKLWIAFTKSPKGEIIIDHGAERAIVNNGKSLLPSGIKEIRGRFTVGDSVVLLSDKGDEVAIGIANYPSADLKKIKGVKSFEIQSILGYKHDDEVIHRDNLILSSQMNEEDEACQSEP
jgi:glutamate 5-kinase